MGQFDDGENHAFRRGADESGVSYCVDMGQPRPAYVAKSNTLFGVRNLILP